MIIFVTTVTSQSPLYPIGPSIRRQLPLLSESHLSLSSPSFLPLAAGSHHQSDQVSEPICSFSRNHPLWLLGFGQMISPKSDFSCLSLRRNFWTTFGGEVDAIHPRDCLPMRFRCFWPFGMSKASTLCNIGGVTLQHFNNVCVFTPIAHLYPCLVHNQSLSGNGLQSPRNFFSICHVNFSHHVEELENFQLLPNDWNYLALVPLTFFHSLAIEITSLCCCNLHCKIYSNQNLIVLIFKHWQFLLMNGQNKKQLNSKHAL